MFLFNKTDNENDKFEFLISFGRRILNELVLTFLFKYDQKIIMLAKILFKEKILIKFSEFCRKSNQEYIYVDGGYIIK